MNRQRKIYTSRRWLIQQSQCRAELRFKKKFWISKMSGDFEFIRTFVRFSYVRAITGSTVGISKIYGINICGIDCVAPMGFESWEMKWPVTNSWGITSRSPFHHIWSSRQSKMGKVRLESLRALTLCWQKSDRKILSPECNSENLLFDITYRGRTTLVATWPSRPMPTASRRPGITLPSL